MKTCVVFCYNFQSESTETEGRGRGKGKRGLTCIPSGLFCFPPIIDLRYGFCVERWRQVSFKPNIAFTCFSSVSQLLFMKV